MIDLAEINEKIISFYKAAVEDNLLSNNQFEEIEKSLHRDKATISIMGQVKAGKSTFINALFFDRDILPVSSIPATATLTELYYSEEEPESVEIEFLTKEDWDSILEMSKEKSIENESFLIQDIKTIIETANKNLGAEVKKLLGGKRKIELHKLRDYVSAEGKYTPLVKNAKIFLKNEVLKSFNIVDTPGINDPVQSRERKSMEFISKSDVVILVINSNRPFDATDMLLIQKLYSVGIGRLIIVVNKIDDVLVEEGNEIKIRGRIISELSKMIKVMTNEEWAGRAIQVLQEAKENIICTSSLWEMLSKYSIEEIERDEDLKFYYERAKETLEKIGTSIDNPQELKNKSGFSTVKNEIEKMLKNGIVKVKIEKNKNYLIGLYSKKIEELIFNKSKLESEKEFLSKNVDMLIEESKRLKSFMREAEEIIKVKEIEIIDRFSVSFSKFVNSVVSDILEAKSKCMGEVKERVTKTSLLSVIFNQKRLVDNVNSYLYDLEKDIVSKINQKWEQTINENLFLLKEKIPELMREMDLKASYSLGLSYKTFKDFYETFMTKMRDERGDKFRGIKLNFSIQYQEGQFGLLKSSFIQDLENNIVTIFDKAFAFLNSQLIETRESAKKINKDYFGRIEREVLAPVEDAISDAIKNASVKELREKEIQSEIMEIERKVEYLQKKMVEIEKAFSLLG